MTPVSAPSIISDPEGLEEKLRQARHLLRSGRIDQARELCLHLYGLGHQDHELCRLLGLIHHTLRDLENGCLFFAEAARHAPQNPIYHYNHGMVLSEQGKTSAAIGPLQTAVRLRPDFAAAYLALGNIAMMDRRPNEAVNHYAKAIEADPACTSAYCNLAMAYTELGFWQSAVPVLEKAAAIAQQDAGILRQLGDLFHLHNRLTEAAQAYVKASGIFPDDAAILEKLGDVRAEMGEQSAAMACYHRVLTLQPANRRALNNLAMILHDLGRTDEAIGLYRQALALSTDLAEVHYNLGNALMTKGAREEALSHYQQATRLKPGYADAWFNTGVACQKLQRFADAGLAYQQVLALDPANLQALFNLALTRQARHLIDQAIADYQKVLALDPRHSTAHYNLGIALGEAGRHAEAVLSFRHSLALDPGNIKALNNLGLALHETAAYEEAASAFRQAIDVQPDFAEAYSNLGNTLLAQGRAEEAFTTFQQAIAADPAFAKAHYNLGCMLQQRNAPAAAAAMYRKAIERDPGLVEAHWNLSNVLLLQGDLVEGFSQYSWRWKRKSADVIVLPLPEWQGESRPDQTLLIITEQGKGDTLQFVRYLPLVKERVGRIIMACEESLQEILGSMPDIDRIIRKREIASLPGDAAACYVPLLNLPGLLNTSLAAMPRQIPYLFPDPRRIDTFASLFADHRHQLKVGMVWRGNPGHKNDHNRSCRGDELAPLAGLAGVSLFSLQMSETPPAALPDVIDLAPRIRSFADTAAIMAHLDLIISVDTAVAHLAGALGRPVWTLIPFVPDWRWMLERADTPWYPTMRLFRQDADKSWEKVILAVREHLLRLRDSLTGDYIYS